MEDQMYDDQSKKGALEKARHLHRIGTNYQQLPVNSPRSAVNSYNKDGAMRYEHRGDQPVYAPNSHGGPKADPIRFGDPGWYVEGEEIVRTAAAPHPEDDDFIQAGNLYRDVMSLPRWATRS
jgi:catalase